MPTSACSGCVPLTDFDRKTRQRYSLAQMPTTARVSCLSLPPFALVQQPVPVVSCHDICGKEDRSVMAMVAGWAVFSLRGRMRGKKKYSKVRAA
jgi:hypothetical protein